MQIEFVKPSIQAGRSYRGEISRYTTNRSKTALYVFVVIDEEPELEFMKKFDADMSIFSQLADFCADMDIFLDELIADLEQLKGRRVIVRLKRGRNQKLYVEKIRLDEEYYSEEDEEERDDE